MKLYHIEIMESGKVNDYYWYWLCNIPGIGRAKMNILLDEYGDAMNVYQSDFNTYNAPYGISGRDIEHINEAKKDNRIYEEFCALADNNIIFVHRQSALYPERLKNISDAPIALYMRGRCVDNDAITVAIIGARGCSEYGRQTAYNLGRSFAYMGIQVVSGMALGIDAAGQRGCVDGGGMSTAVLGCGVDVCYPRENIELYSRLIESGGVISEYHPESKPNKGAFPERNRIISGLADVVIVVEARKRSGSLITVDQALEQNKEIMAVPGRIDDPLSAGCNELIKLGAMIITCADDIKQIDAVRQWVEKRAEQEKNNFKIGKTQCWNDFEKDYFNNSDINLLASEKNMVYSTTNLYPKDIDTIIKESGLDISVVSQQLFELQLQGAVKEVGKNCYVRCSI